MRTALHARPPTHPGLNDGLIHPGSDFPIHSALRVIRSKALERGPMHGALRIIVVLAEFTDRKMGASKQHYEELFFSTGVLQNGSVKEYFDEVTNGKVDIVGEVVGPYTLPNTLAEYANNDFGTSRYGMNARLMARHAAEAANPDVDFAPYDNDGDGYVDAFIVVHAGQGAEMTGDVNDIWSHKWVLPDAAYNADGTRVYGYLTVPEDAKIGVCCHELGHLLFGFPDLYDIDDSSEGIGNWCLMGGGSWLGGGDIPAHPSAWCKLQQDWATSVNVTSNQELQIQDVKTGFKIYRLWKDGTANQEYFLVENRQKSGYDQLLPGEGLLVWHIDDDIETNSDEAHPKVALVQADTLKDLENGNNRGDDGDPFPGSQANRVFDTVSNPGSKSYASVHTCVALRDISDSGATMMARVEVSCPDEPVSFWVRLWRWFFG
ncbi:MAG: M6 family metalloprotease domain-containing protein [Chloroflexi bacterium]|nr:MAG: M6 family metalloprotease domain-containing protein [Chloroflexota bacterium]MBL1194278.1 M6 family metalloprotease domain-containing protein [Chloroflexota bacterium]NOH11568.1 M6 family metalloprotease domain-containing protein [Chloroflexota bacterium]